MMKFEIIRPEKKDPCYEIIVNYRELDNGSLGICHVFNEAGEYEERMIKLLEIIDFYSQQRFKILVLNERNLDIFVKEGSITEEDKKFLLNSNLIVSKDAIYESWEIVYLDEYRNRYKVKYESSIYR